MRVIKFAVPARFPVPWPRLRISGQRSPSGGHGEPQGRVGLVIQPYGCQTVLPLGFLGLCGL